MESIPSTFSRKPWPYRWLLVCVVFFVACDGSHQKPRTREDIFNDRLSVDTLYLTNGGREIIAPGNVRGAIIDPDTGELAWRAWQCNNPDCPGRKADGSPYLFTRPDPLAFVNEEGDIDIRQPKTAEEYEQMGEFIQRKCPQCSTLSVSAGQQRPLVVIYVLPQAKAQLRQLDEEYRKYLAVEQKRTGE